MGEGIHLGEVARDLGPGAKEVSAASGWRKGEIRVSFYIREGSDGILWAEAGKSGLRVAFAGLK